MKKQFLQKTLLIVAVAWGLCLTAIAQTVIPYFSAENIKTDLSTVGSTVADLGAFVIPAGDFTLELQGTADTKITLRYANNIGYEYTPTATGNVRFVQIGGLMYVYEGTTYKANIATTSFPITYPEITDETATTSADQLLANPSFETLGTTIVDGKYGFGTPWVTNVTPAEYGIRIGTVNGSHVCVWRGSGNSNYFAQQLATAIKPNTSYKVTVRQVASGNGHANFNVGLGSTANGMEYGSTVIHLGNDAASYTRTVTFTTGTVVENPAYFTFMNTSANTSSAGSDPLSQMDYLALVEGTCDVAAGITNATAAVLVDGTAYAPEGVTGDYYDMTSYIANPGFELGTSTLVKANSGDDFYAPTNWTLDEYDSSDGSWDHSAVDNSTKHNGSYAFRLRFRWADSRSASFIQTTSTLPVGKYKITAYANTNDVRNPKASVFVKNSSAVVIGTSTTDLTTANIWTELSSTFTLTEEGTITIGGKCTATAPADYEGRFWFDDFSLIYYGIDKSELQALVDSATVIYNTNKDSYSIAFLNDSIVAATAVLNNSGATLQQIAAQETAMKAAIAKVYVIKEIADRTAAWAPLPYNATSELGANLSFESGFAGWTNNGFATQTNTSLAEYKDGNTYAEKWINSGSTLADYDMYRTFENLPNGIYIVTVGAQGIQQQTGTYPGGVFLYANEVQKEVGAMGYYYVAVTVTDNTLKIGYKTVSTGCNWVAVDNFTIQYCGTAASEVCTNADLSALSTTGYGLNPAFDANIVLYKDTVKGGTVVVSATPAIQWATVTGTGTVTLTPGAYTNDTVTVTALDGVTTKQYVISIYSDLSNNANLSAIQLSTGALTTAFDANTTTYDVQFVKGTTSITVTPVLADVTATITSGGGAVDVSSGTATHTITIKAEDGTEKTYTLNFAVSTNLMFGWDANGATDKSPYDAGWRTTAIVNWNATPGSGYDYQYRDNLSRSGAGIGRVFAHGTNTAPLSYPISVEEGKVYSFSCIAAQFNGPYNMIFAINTAEDASGTTMATQTANAAKWDAITNFSFTFVAQTTSVVYVIWQGVSGNGERSLAYAFNVTETGDAVKVTYEENGGSAVADQYLVSGTAATKPADPTKEDYTFGGWFTDVDCINSYDFATTLTENKTLYAKWVSEPTALDNNISGVVRVMSFDRQIIVTNMATDARIAIYDVAGRKLVSEKANTTVYNRTMPQAGCYMVCVEQNGEKMIQRVIVK